MLCETCQINLNTDSKRQRFCISCAKNRKKNYHKGWYTTGGKERTDASRKAATLRHKKKYEDNIVYRIYCRTKGRAQAYKIDFKITQTDIKVPEVCPIFGTPFIFKTDKTASLDRIDSSKGYLQDNVQVLSWKANTMKNNATPEELIQFADWIYKTHKKETIK